MRILCCNNLLIYVSKFGQLAAIDTQGASLILPTQAGYCTSLNYQLRRLSTVTTNEFRSVPFIHFSRSSKWKRQLEQWLFLVTIPDVEPALSWLRWEEQIGATSIQRLSKAKVVLAAGTAVGVVVL